MHGNVAKWSDQVAQQTCAHASHARGAVRADACADLLLSCLFDHGMVVEMNSWMRWVVFGFSQISISTLQFRLVALRSIGLILLSIMLRVLSFPYAHLTRKCLNRVGVSNYIRVRLNINQWFTVFIVLLFN